MRHLAVVVTGLAIWASGVLIAQTQGTGSKARALPQPRAEHNAIALNGKIYAVGGGIPDPSGKGMLDRGASTLVEEYDPATDRWRVRAPLPHALTHVGLTGLDGKLYAVGGFTHDVHEDAQP